MNIPRDKILHLIMGTLVAQGEAQIAPQPQQPEGT
jgi:hypothetical protein